MKNTKFHSFLLAGIMLATGVFVGCSEEESVPGEMQMIVINYEDTTAIEDGLRGTTRSQCASTRTESGILVSKSGEKLRLSCTEAPMPPKTVGVTRGAKVPTAGISSLGVSAAVYPAAGSYTSVGCGSYFYKEEVVSGSPTKYFWPGSDYKLAFYAYYPYGSTAFTVQSSASALGVPTYAYTVPSSPASQSDIMTGQDVSVPGDSETPANITLKHRCSSINFKVKNERSEAITVNSISIVGVKYAGTLNGSIWTLGSSVNSGTMNPFTLTSNATVAAGETVSITGTDNIFMMLPQTLPSTAKLKVVIDDEEYETAMTGTWEPGKGYTYTISMTQTDVNYLNFKAEEAGTFTLKIPANVNTSSLESVSYSLDGGATWTTRSNSSSAVTITTPTVAAGDSVLWKGTGKQYATGTSSGYYSTFSSTGRFTVSGNIMSLLYGDDHENIFIFPNNSAWTFCYLFKDNTRLTSVEGLELPATTLAQSCYYYMFSGCTSLTTAPELPATTLTSNCYSGMFRGCTSLTTAPELPATTLAENCYNQMFISCTSLTTVPELPVTTLANNCYRAMFNYCTSLTTAPELPATTLADRCYNQMFSNCTSLTAAPELPATTLAQGCYSAMFNSCTSLTAAPELPATTLAEECYYSMFQRCTSLTTAPELPATTLTPYCYYLMFSGCTSLPAAPELPATTLVSHCYHNMFKGCSKLKYIKAAFTTTPGTSLTSEWVSGVSSTGTFVKNSAATWNVTGTSGVPSSWTLQTYTP